MLVKVMCCSLVFYNLGGGLFKMWLAGGGVDVFKMWFHFVPCLLGTWCVLIVFLVLNCFLAKVDLRRGPL